MNLLMVIANGHGALGPVDDAGGTATLDIALFAIMPLVRVALVERALGYYPHSTEEILWGFHRCLCLFYNSILIRTVAPLVLRRCRVAFTFLREVRKLPLLFSAHFLITQAQITNFDLGFNRHIRCLPLGSFFAFGLYNESILEALLPLEANGASR